MNMPSFSDAVFIPDLREGIQIPQKGIANRILQDDDKLKIIAHTPVVMLLAMIKDDKSGTRDE